MLVSSNYTASSLLHNNHLHTIIPSLFFKHDLEYTHRERIELSDNDFIDIDWLKSDNKKLVLLLHGLESSTKQFYMKHTAEFLSKKKCDIVAMNYRGCSGETNNLYKSYHSGSSHDLASVITDINKKNNYEEFYIVGFSLGGNILLKYLAEYQDRVPSNFIKGVAFSAPIDLKGVSLQLSSTFRGLYQRHFLKKLNKKLIEKTSIYPDHITLNEIEKLTTLKKFDDFYTAPANGFNDAFHYYEECSSKPILRNVKHPVLLVNALDDPFLPKSCYPFDILCEHKFIDFETPKTGGHLAFVTSLIGHTCWYPQRIWDYINER